MLTWQNPGLIGVKIMSRIWFVVLNASTLLVFLAILLAGAPPLAALCGSLGFGIGLIITKIDF